MLESIDTEHLTYEPLTGLIYLRRDWVNNDGDDDWALGSPESATCPKTEYQEEWDELRRQVLGDRQVHEDAHNP